MRQRPKRITNELELLKDLSLRSQAEGYLVVVTPGVERDQSNRESVARLLRLSDVDARRLFSATVAMPVARVSSIDEAEQLRKELRAFEIQSVAIPESVLRLSDEGRRIRALMLTDESLTGIGAGKDMQVTARFDEIQLIVQGRLFSRRIEAEETKAGRRTKLVDKRELSTDDSVLDIYAGSDNVNWRIVANNFDFSCLGRAKRATAFENFTVLLELLCARASAAFDCDYTQSRHLLGTVWPLAQRVTKEQGGRSRGRKFDTATITVTDNEAQFTRYSRLRHYLACQELVAAG